MSRAGLRPAGSPTTGGHDAANYDESRAHRRATVEGNEPLRSGLTRGPRNADEVGLGVRTFVSDQELRRPCLRRPTALSKAASSSSTESTAPLFELVEEFGRRTALRCLIEARRMCRYGVPSALPGRHDARQFEFGPKSAIGRGLLALFTSSLRPRLVAPVFAVVVLAALVVLLAREAAIAGSATTTGITWPAVMAATSRISSSHTTSTGQRCRFSPSGFCSGWSVCRATCRTRAVLVVLHLTAAGLLRVVMRRAGVGPWIATAGRPCYWCSSARVPR